MEPIEGLIKNNYYCICDAPVVWGQNKCIHCGTALEWKPRYRRLHGRFIRYDPDGKTVELTEGQFMDGILQQARERGERA